MKRKYQEEKTIDSEAPASQTKNFRTNESLLPSQTSHPPAPTFKLKTTAPMLLNENDLSQSSVELP